MSKILIVDDSETIRHTVRRTLSAAGYEVVEASDGAEGLELVQSTQDLCLVLCDIVMPVMNGLEMLDKVRVVAPNLPIIMLTTEVQPTLIRRAKNAGAKGWIVKPVKPEMLLAAMNRALGVAPA